MPGSTALPLSIPYMLATDDLASLDEFLLNLATRLHDLIAQRQGGVLSITPTAANTDTTVRVNFPWSFLDTPRVIVGFREALTPGSSVCWATGADVDGFTCGLRSINVANRALTWIAVPSS